MEYIRIDCLRGFRDVHLYYRDVGEQETDELDPKSGTESWAIDVVKTRLLEFMQRVNGLKIDVQAPEQRLPKILEAFARAGKRSGSH